MIPGHCLCGAVTIAISGLDDPRVGVCHCRMCRRWSGGVNMGFGAEARAVTVTGRVSRYRSSSFAERALGPVCGSHLWYRDASSLSKAHYAKFGDQRLFMAGTPETKIIETFAAKPDEE